MNRQRSGISDSGLKQLGILLVMDTLMMHMRIL